MALVQQRVKYTEPGRGSVTAFSTMRPESCNEPKCTSLCGAEHIYPKAPGVVPSCGTRSPLRAPVCPGGGGAPKGLAQPRVGGPRAGAAPPRPRAGAALGAARGLSSWKPRARVASEPRRRGWSQAARRRPIAQRQGRSPKGEKESAAENKEAHCGKTGRIRVPGAGLWPSAPKDSVLGDPALIPAAFTTSALPPKRKVSLVR